MPFDDPALKPKVSRPVYRLADGTRVPSVTQVISATFAKPGLTKWANRLGMQGVDADAFRDQRAAEGSCLHEYIRAHLKLEEPDLEPFSPAARAAGLVAFLRWKRGWYERHDVRPVVIEVPLVSERHQYGGTPDLIAEVDGRVEVLDWKTSKDIYREHLIQASSYAAMAWEHGHRVEAVRVVSISTEADGRLHEHAIAGAEMRPYFACFHAALRLYRHMRSVGDPERMSA